jgi:hypothetical protein
MAGWSYRTLRRRTAVAGALAACVVLLTASCAVGPPRPRSAGPTGRDVSVRVLQMNLCDSGIARCYTGRSVTEATALIRAEAPDVVTVNEVCRADVTALERALADAGGGGRAGTVVSAFQSAWDRRTGAPLRCRNGQLYGIGLVVRRGASSGGYDTTGGVYPVQDTRVPEERAWLCLSPSSTTAATATGASAAGVAVCTTHLTNSSPTVARAQCGYLLGTAIPAVRARGRSVPLVLGGDFNLTSGGTDLRSCVPAGDQRVDDGIVQHVVATPEFVVGGRRTIGMHSTDHPGLLVTLTLGALPSAGEDDGSLAETG